MDKSFTFSDGLTVPQGTRITFPIQAIMDENQEIKDANKFDAYRFLNLRGETSIEKGANDYQWAASTVSQANLM